MGGKNEKSIWGSSIYSLCRVLVLVFRQDVVNLTNPPVVVRYGRLRLAVLVDYWGMGYENNYMNTQEIIQEALDYNMEQEMKSRFTLLDKLFNFSRHNESKMKSSVILYLTNRLRAEMEQRAIAERNEGLAYRNARECLQRYGVEAVLEFEQFCVSSSKELKGVL